MTNTNLPIWLGLILTSLSILNILYTWWRTRDATSAEREKRLAERFSAGSDRMDRHEHRLNSIEQTLRTMPAKDDLHELQLAMERLRGDMGRMGAAMEGHAAIMARVEGIVGRHEQHLLEGKK